MHPKLILFCAYPVTGKTELATYMERELGFARVDWDKIAKESEIYDPSKVPKGYDFRDEAFRRTLTERDQHLSQNKDVVIDSPATDVFSKERLLDTNTRCQKYTIVIEVPKRFHLKLLRKRCPDAIFGLEAVYEIQEGAWWADPIYDKISSEIIRLRNWYFGSLSSMKRKIRRTLENST